MSKYAVVFPGQGSQSLGMLSDLAQRYPLVEETVEIVSDQLNYDVWALIQQGPAERLNETIHTQVIMLAADVAVYRVMMQEHPLTPSMMAGHSLGEYAALVASGALELKDAATLVQTRAKVMQETVPFGFGAMAAIVGLTDEQVRTLCEQVSTSEQVVTPANYNAIGQVVIAGHTQAVHAAIELAETMQARLAKLIPVSVPCHCPLLEGAAEQFGMALSSVSFKTPQCPVVSNVDLSIYHSAEQMRTLLQAQLYRPVRWVETIQLFKQQGVTSVIECGPGKVLSGLVKRIDNTLTSMSVNDPSGLEAMLTFVETH